MTSLTIAVATAEAARSDGLHDAEQHEQVDAGCDSSAPAVQERPTSRMGWRLYRPLSYTRMATA
jgi:hypothetical protein